MTNIAYFREITKGDGKSVGYKGVNLATLVSHCKVPPGFVVTIQAYETFLSKSGLKPKIEAALQKLDAKNIQTVANNIQKTIVETEFPKELSKEILEAYEALGFDEKSSADSLVEKCTESNVAVRASYIKEHKDVDMSQLTFLNIEGKDRLLKSIKVCFAAQFTLNNLKTRKALKAFEDLKNAVVVQKMVDAQKSILAYSYNPNTKNGSQIYIEAIFGLGEGFTLKDTAFDVYIVDKKKLEQKDMIIAEQKKKHVLDPETKKTTRVMLKESGKRQKLNDKEVREVARLTKKIAELYKSEQRVEIAIKDEEFFVLQSKRISGKIEVAPKEEVKIESFDKKEESVVVEKEKPKDELDVMDEYADEVEKTQEPLAVPKEEQSSEAASFAETEPKKVVFEPQEIEETPKPVEQPAEDEVDIKFEDEVQRSETASTDGLEPKPFEEPGEEFEESPSEEDDSIFSSVPDKEDKEKPKEDTEEEKDESIFDRFGTE